MASFVRDIATNKMSYESVFQEIAELRGLSVQLERGEKVDPRIIEEALEVKHFSKLGLDGRVEKYTRALQEELNCRIIRLSFYFLGDNYIPRPSSPKPTYETVYKCLDQLLDMIKRAETEPPERQEAARQAIDKKREEFNGWARRFRNMQFS